MAKEFVSKGAPFTVDYLDRSNLGATSNSLTVSDDDGSVASNAFLGAYAGLSLGAPGLLSGAGAIDLTSVVTKFTSTGAGNALTLANGVKVGQIKIVTHTVKGSSGTGVITPASAGNFATATLTALHDSVTFMWNGASWDLVSMTGSATAT